MTKHTPGPWSVSERVTILAGNKQVARALGAIQPDSRVSHEAADANARLIAAAPELLVIAERFVRWHDGFATNEASAFEKTQQHMALMEEARAAIAKAEGRS